MNDIISELENNFYSFDILQMTAVVKEILGDGDGTVFFESDPSLAFPAADIGYMKIDTNGDGATCARISLPVMNLLGIATPLPIKFTDYITRGRPDAEMYRDFLSIVQNRLHALWVDAHQKYALWSDSGRVAKAIFGLMTAPLPPQAAFYGGALAGLDIFSRRQRSASGLKLLLESIWGGIPVHIEENIGRRASVDECHALDGGLRLGQTATLGTKVFDRSSKFRISLGPLGYNMYRTFLPNGDNYQYLQKILSLYLNEPLICELEVLCPQTELPPVRLGGDCADQGGIGRAAVLGKPAERIENFHRYRRDFVFQSP
ncbi:MAG: type VI secretion system baseplate subunit TssG [Chitinispirillales bacterium]|jgi:type VI secretion system protein ImpH|nr:type VI secretion system baseplate subunit TssG [Chitinispirillales bacterium]